MLLTPHNGCYALALMVRHNPGLGLFAPVISTTRRTGEAEQGELDDKNDLWSAPEGSSRHDVAPWVVCLLTPFDPLVWVRHCFERL